MGTVVHWATAGKGPLFLVGVGEHTPTTGLKSQPICISWRLPAESQLGQREIAEFFPLLQLRESKETLLGKEQMSQGEKSHHRRKGGSSGHAARK